MTDLNAIVRATVRSAKAVERIALWQRKMREAHTYEAEAYYKGQLARARRDHTRAQRVLAANPLPGDRAWACPLLD